MSDATSPDRRRQWFVIGGVFAVVVAMLAAGYYLFLSGGYVVLADHVRPGEAAAIVAELDKRGTAYRLRDGGTTILVPDDEADATRLALVRSDAAVAGQIGFELFNKSDMGLTNFAQKINYQRALQGELVRTITLMDGVESARVHLALPERALFRDDRTEPSAAVTVAMRAGLVPDMARVAGIQRLVSAAVSDLPPERVVVLDADGRVISQTSTAAAIAPDGQPADIEARAAVEQYYRARARGAIDAERPDLRYQLRVEALPQADTTIDPTRWTPGGAGDARNFRLRLTLVTPEPLDIAVRDRIQAVITPAAGLDDALGDLLVFETGPVAPMPAATPAPVVPTARLPEAAFVPPVVTGSAVPWTIGIALALLALVLLYRRRIARTRALSNDDRDAFARILRHRLAEGTGDAVR